MTNGLPHSPAAPSLLSIDNLEVGYAGSVVLRQVSMRVPAGRIVCLMGRNGVGKTTLLKSIMGLLKPQSGSITMDGADITKMPPYRRARAGIGYVPQGREIFPFLTVQENLALALEARDQPSGGVPDHIYDLFPMLKQMLARRGGQLSGGQQQQLAIARALVGAPKLLLLDEPMEGIQPSTVQEIERALEIIREQRQIAVVLVEQSLSFATTIADYYYVMSKGSMVAEGNSEELTSDAVRAHLTV